MPTVKLMPPPIVQFFDASGIPLADGKLYTWEPGQPGVWKDTYTDSTGTTKNTVSGLPDYPHVVLDSAGRASVWLDGYYDISVSDKNGVSQWSQNNVSAMMSTNTEYFVSDYDDLDDAITSIGSTNVNLHINATTTAGTLAVPENIRLIMDPGGLISIPDGVTLTINSSFTAGLANYFDYHNTGLVVFGDSSVTQVHPEWFGAVSDGVTDCTTAINSAVASFGVVKFGKGIYNISGPITITDSVTRIIGEGQALTFVVQTDPSSSGFVFNYTTPLPGGGIESMSIHAKSPFYTGSGSTGRGVEVSNSNGAFVARNIDIQAFDIGYMVTSSFYSELSSSQILYCTTAGIYAAPPLYGVSASAGNRFNNVKVSNYGFTGTNTNSIGFFIEQSAGDVIDSVDVTCFNTGVMIQPSTGNYVTYLFAKSLLADTSNVAGIMVDASNSSISACEFVDCWAAYTTDGPGIKFLTSTGVIDGIQWIGGRVRENGTYGVYVSGATKNVTFCGTHIAQNSQKTTDTYDGVFLTGGDLSDIIFSACIIGNFASGLTSTQANGIYIDTTVTGRVSIQNCNTAQMGSGKQGVYNASSVAPFMTGIYPLLYGYNPPYNRTISFAATGNLSAGSTYYLGSNGSQAAAVDTTIVSGISGTVTKLRGQSVSAPGAGQTFTYTLQLDGVDTDIVATTSGSGVFESVAYGSVVVTESSALTVKVVASGSATATKHRGVLLISA